MSRMISPAEARERSYPFVAYPETDGGYSIAFPDLPGVTTVADTLAAVPEAIRDVLAFTFDGDEADGRLVPAPAERFPDDGIVTLFGNQTVVWNPEAPLYSAQEVAERLGLTPRAVNAAAAKAGLGHIVGQQRVFTDSDLAQLEDRRPVGRPRAAD